MIDRYELELQEAATRARVACLTAADAYDRAVLRVVTEGTRLAEQKRSRARRAYDQAQEVYREADRKYKSYIDRKNEN